MFFPPFVHSLPLTTLTPTPLPSHPDGVPASALSYSLECGPQSSNEIRELVRKATYLPSPRPAGRIMGHGSSHDAGPLSTPFCHMLASMCLSSFPSLPTL